MRAPRRLVRSFALASSLGIVARGAAAQSHSATEKKTGATTHPSDSTASIDERIARLDQKIRELERLRERDQEAAAARAREAPLLRADRNGFSIESADSAFRIRFGGYAQADARYSVHDAARTFTNTFMMRRVRPVLDGTLHRFVDFRIMPDFGQGTVTLFDAYVDIHLHKLFTLRAGKYKPPIGLERLQSATDLLFAERGFPTDLAPSRDLGLQAAGEMRGGSVQYQVGIFNGTVDLGNGDADNGNGKDGAGRVWLQPFRSTGPRALSALAFGVAASRGIHRGTTAAPFLAAYRSPLQAIVFSYRTDGTARGIVLASGTHTRVSPQAYFATGRFGLLGEYAMSEQKVKRDTAQTTLTHRAWQLAASWVLTGEQAGFRGIAPKRPFDPTHHRWGAFELGTRVGGLTLDRDAFPLFADPTTSVHDARSVGVAFNWYLARGVRVQLDYENTTFTGGAAAGANRPTEQALLTRFQFAF